MNWRERFPDAAGWRIVPESIGRLGGRATSEFIYEEHGT